MPLQSSGSIKMSQIKTELGSSSNILRVYSEAAGKTAPHSMKEFLGYSHTPTPTPPTPTPPTPTPPTPTPPTPTPPTPTPEPPAPPPAVYYAYTLFYSPSQVCNGTQVTKYSQSSPVVLLSRLYNNNDGTGTPTDGYYYYADTDKLWTVTSGRVELIGDCPASPPTPTPTPPTPTPTPPTPTPTPVTWTAITLAFGTGGATGTACTNVNSGLGSTLYMDELSFETANNIRLNADGTGIPRNGNWSNGVRVRTSTNGSLSGDTMCDQA